ncbi:right-handed parallel beta-helix repeat-containing protein [Geminisphaera colitermitum]|uniref:right-handed parallel beta-helix repeat-containing protein n=1 Tax=Geminisphaera colitermitum TaxID=1148786 RepID=UPI0012FF13D1|nr:right-handed parallel beta-helix repeat-containing protein [Geminisphaera colitermitum]
MKPLSRLFLFSTICVITPCLMASTPPKPDADDNAVCDHAASTRIGYELELVPGYEACSIYLHGCKAPATNQFRGEVFFRIMEPVTQGINSLPSSPPGEWRRAFDLVYMPGEKSARGSLLRLPENAACQLRLNIDDNGKKQTIEREFRTLASKVPIAKTIELGPGTKLPLIITQTQSGAPGAYIRYTSPPGLILDSGNHSTDTITIDGASHIILDGLTLRGGRINAINLNNASHIQILNCDIAGFGRVGVRKPERDGKFYESGRALNNDAGIRISGGQNILIERCYIHDPRGTANPWFYSHPAGPNAVFATKAAQVVLRYNDFIGSDLKRWNDAIEGGRNGFPDGGVYRDAEIYGNYFAFGNDDGMELDGGQMNTRFLHNKVEGTLCGVSTAPCLSGPSWIIGNLFSQPGDEFGFTGNAIKNNYRVTGQGRIFFLHNTIAGDWNGLSGYGGPRTELEKMHGIVKGFARNNLIAITANPVSPGLFIFANDFDHDLLFTTSDAHRQNLAVLQKKSGQERNGINARPKFVDATHGDYNLSPDSPGYAQGIVLPGLHPPHDARPSHGAFQPGGITDLPYRPVPFHTNVARLDFSAASAHEWTTQQVTVTVDAPGFRSDFQVLRNEASRFIHVTPERGTLAHGQPFTLTVAIDPAHITSARINAGAFLVRLPDGFSRVLTIYADSTRDLKLLARDRAGAIHGKVFRQTNEHGETMLTVDIPVSGKYYMFVKTTEQTGVKVPVNIDGGEFHELMLRGKPGAEERWMNLGTNAYADSRNPNRPLEFTTGKHTVQLRDLRQQVAGFALAERPETFLLALTQDL